MATATIVAAWRDATKAHIAVRVSEVGGDNVEYIASVERTAEFEALSNADKKAALVAAAKVVRDAQRQPAPVSLGITGTATL